MSRIALPGCPACGTSEAGWLIDSPVAAVDRVRLDGSGLTPLGLLAPDEGLAPLGRPDIRCAACGATADAEVLRDAVLAAAIAADRGQGTHPPH